MIAGLRQQLADLQNKLEAATATLHAERAQHVARIEEIDRELAGEAKPTRTRNKGFSANLIAFVEAHPWSTIKQVQAAHPDLPAASVDATIRKLAAKGTLTKDNNVPRRFSVPAKPATERATARAS
jgi:hypothetical protein